MSDTVQSLLAYASNVAGERPESMAKAIANATPDFENADYLDSELRELWPELPPEARIIAVLLAKHIARETLMNEDRY